MISSVEKLYSTINNQFTSYKMTLSNDQIFIVPLDPANRDYQAIQEWAAIEGNNIIDPGA